MKKLTAFLLVLAVAVSASAGAPFKKERLSEVLKSADKTQRVQALRHKKNQMTSHFMTASQAEQARTKGLKKARVQAESTPEEVVITSCTPTFYPEDQAVWYGLYPEDWSKTFYFSIKVEPGKRDVELGRTYTLADMEEGPVNHWEDSEWNEYPFVEATFTKTRGAGYDNHVVATATDEKGQSFVLRYDEEPVVITGDTVDIAFTEDRPDVELLNDGSWLFRAGGEQLGYSVQLTYFSENMLSCGGSFTAENLDLSMSSIALFGPADEYGDREVKFLNLKDGAFEVADTDEAYTLTGCFVADDGNVYRVNIVCKKPKAEKTVVIQSNNLKYDDYWFDYTQEVKFLASDDVNEVELVLYPASLGDGMTGLYTIGLGGTTATVRTVDWMDDVETTAFSGTVNLVYEEGSIHITGSILCYDNVQYNLELNYYKPVKTREQSLEFENLHMALYEDNSWQVMGYNAAGDAYFTIAAIPPYGTVSGTYTEKELVMDYCSVVTDISVDAYKSFVIAEANLSVNYNSADSTVSITGTLLCVNQADRTDVPLFTVTVTAKIPDPYLFDEAEKDFDHEFPQYVLNTDDAEDYGILYVNALDDRFSIGLQFMLTPGATGLEPAVYPINDTQEPGTVLASPGMTPNGSVTYSFALIGNPETAMIENGWLLVSGNVTVDPTGLITVDAVNKKGRKVTARLTAPQAVEDVQGDKVQSTKFIRDGRLLILRGNKTYTVTGEEVR